MDANAYGKSLDNRVSEHTNPLVNQMIMMQTEKSLLFYAEHPDQINDRIGYLKTENDIEQTLEKNAAILGLFGLFMSVILRRKMFILLPIIVLGFLLQHAFQGWCPPISLFRRMGVRTKEEVQLELYGLRMLKGDFNDAPEINQMEAKNRVEQVMQVLSR